MTSYRIETFTLHDYCPAIVLDRVVEDVSPNFRLIGLDDEMADVMFALYDGEKFQQRWHPEICGVIVSWLRDIVKRGYLWVQTWDDSHLPGEEPGVTVWKDDWVQVKMSDEDVSKLDEAADYIESLR
ncbi:hypothetical protein [Halomonas sp.]|uniref:hypothetical protein n=1 Tax=Halomonas sp. TaxID=1486246 RepID=UPI003563AB8E